MKKTLSLILAVIMTVSLFAGCTGGKKEELANFNPDLKLEDLGGLKLPLAENNDKIVWSVDSSDTDLNNKYVTKKLREATGVNLELLILAQASSGQKINVLAASNQLPDIVGQGLEPAFAEDLSLQGAFR